MITTTPTQSGRSSPNITTIPSQSGRSSPNIATTQGLVEIDEVQPINFDLSTFRR